MVMPVPISAGRRPLVLAALVAATAAVEREAAGDTQPAFATKQLDFSVQAARMGLSTLQSGTFGHSEMTWTAFIDARQNVAEAVRTVPAFRAC